MGRLLKIHEIDEFSEVKTIPDAAINGLILSNVRKLDEENELERGLREILYDPNKTPHGPTEIADVLTSHLHVRGDKRLAAFVLKGKSFQRVSSKNVTHQFVKLRQVPELGLMVFVAVGNIQDDAQRDFVQTAIDAGCDYFIIDAQDLARLFIAYEKICPRDGTAYDETGACREGHVLDEGLTLEMEVREGTRYTIVKQRDISHYGAKRYSATILLDRHYPKDAIRAIIEEATEKIKHSRYYRSERVRAHWRETPAHVVWLFLAHDLEDIINVNWVCRTCWIDPSLPEDVRPRGLNGNEQLGDIQVFWNDNYKSYKQFFERFSGTKEEVLEAISPILEEMARLAKKGISCFNEYIAGRMSEDDFIQEMQQIEPRVVELHRQAGNVPIPPEDCKDYDQTCQSLFATIHNMFLYYSQRGLETWAKSNRDWLMQDTIRRFYDDWKRVEFEESKLH